MNIRDLIKRIKQSNKRVKLITFMGISAIALIFISEMLPERSTKEADPPSESSFTAASDYSDKVGKRLEELLSQIKGVGRAELILSVEGSEEYVYAEELETSAEHGENDSTEKYKNKLFVSDHSGSKDAVVKKVINPRFNGALVICDGGDDILIKERVIKAVSAALDLPTSKICVESRMN